MTFQSYCMIVAGLAYCGAAGGYLLAGKYPLGICMALYAASCMMLLIEGSK